MMPPRAQASTLVVLAIAALRVGVRDRTFWWLALLFLALVLVSAYLGWSATATANAVYLKSAAMLQEQGKTVPPNPVVESSPLALLRNMATYVALLGALAGIVLGHQMVAADRKAGVVPLLASRPVGRMTLAISKILALVIAIAGLLALSCAVNAVTMLVISGASLSGEIWLRLGAFCAVSALFVLAFALLGAVCAAVCRSEFDCAAAAGHNLADVDLYRSPAHRQHQSDGGAQSSKLDSSATTWGFLRGDRRRSRPGVDCWSLPGVGSISSRLCSRWARAACGHQGGNDPDTRYCRDDRRGSDCRPPPRCLSERL